MIKLLQHKEKSYNSASLRYHWCLQHTQLNSTKTFDIVAWNVLFPFPNFHDNFISLMENNIQSKNEYKWSLWPIYPCQAGNFAGLPTLHISACCSNQFITHFSDNDKGLKVYRQETHKSK